jgi:hypothetical protein
MNWFPYSDSALFANTVGSLVLLAIVLLLRFILVQAVKYWLSTPSVELRVAIEMHDPKRINLLLRIPVPARQKGALEQAILRRFLSTFYQANARTPAENLK